MFKKSFLHLTAVVLFLGFFATASVAMVPIPTEIDVFVDDEGLDSNTGASKEEPVATLTKALELVAGFDKGTIILLEGDYITPAVTLSYHKDLTITAYEKEGVYDPVTLYSDYSYTSVDHYNMYASRWILDLGSSVGNSGSFGNFTLSHVALSGDNFLTADVVEDGSSVVGVHAYSLDYGSPSITIEACRFENMYYGLQEAYSDDLDIILRNNTITARVPVSIESNGSSTVQIEGNTIKKTDDQSWGTVIGLHYVRANTIIHNNTIDGGASGVGRGIYDYFAQGTISNNHFVNLTDGVELDDVIELTISENFFDMKKGNAISMDIDYRQLGKVTIRDNVIQSFPGLGGDGIAISIDKYNSDQGNGDYTISGNTIKNFNYGVQFNNDSMEFPDFLTIGGSEEDGNTFSGNYVNVFCDYASKEAPVASDKTAYFTFTHNDWGTEDLGIIEKKIVLNGIDRETYADYIDLEAVATTDAPNEVWVDGNFTPENAGIHDYGTDAFNTIAEAKASVRIGGTVHIGAGTYDGEVLLFDGVTLLGAGEATIVKHSQKSAALLICGEGIHIEGLNLYGGKYGAMIGDLNLINPQLISEIYKEAYPMYVKDITLKDNFFTNQTREIEYEPAFSLYLQSYTYDFENILLDGNVFTNDGDLIQYAVYGYGYLKNTVVKNNRVIKGYEQGMYLQSKDGMEFVNNEIYIDGDTGSNFAVAIISAGDTLVRNNRIIKNLSSASGSMIGLYLSLNTDDSSGATFKYRVENSTISGFPQGIMFSKNTNNSLADVVIGGEAAKANDLSGNTISLINSCLETTIDATYNIWGVDDEAIMTLIYDSNYSGYYGPVIYLPSYKLLSKDATLASLEASEAVLTPEFSGDRQSYLSEVDFSVEATTVVVTTTSAGATVLINGVERRIAAIDLMVGENSVTVKVTAEDGVTESTYTLVITRADEDPPGDTSEETGDETASTDTTSVPSVVVTTSINDQTSVFTTKISGISIKETTLINLSPRVVDALITELKEKGSFGKNTVLEITVDTPEDREGMEVTLDGGYLERIVTETDASLRIAASFATVEFDPIALDAIASVQMGGKVSIRATTADPLLLSEEDRAKVADRPIYAFEVKNGNTPVSYFNGGHATITVPYILREGENPNAIVVYYMGDDGVLENVMGRYHADLKAVVFVTTHFSKFLIGHHLVVFEDVVSGAWYKDAVDYIAARGITTGTGGKRYSPMTSLTRGQFLVMLMKSYQIEAEASREGENFTDAGDTYYTNYLATGKKLGLVKGIGNNMYAPEATISRQEMFLLVYNVLEYMDALPELHSATPGEFQSFKDASQVADWAKEGLVALYNRGVFFGNNNLISPKATTTRAEMAQVLYNLQTK